MELQENTIGLIEQVGVNLYSDCAHFDSLPEHRLALSKLFAVFLSASMKFVGDYPNRHRPLPPRFLSCAQRYITSILKALLKNQRITTERGSDYRHAYRILVRKSNIINSWWLWRWYIAFIAVLRDYKTFLTFLYNERLCNVGNTRQGPESQ